MSWVPGSPARLDTREDKLPTVRTSQRETVGIVPRVQVDKPVLFHADVFALEMHEDLTRLVETGDSNSPELAPAATVEFDNFISIVGEDRFSRVAFDNSRL